MTPRLLALLLVILVAAPAACASDDPAAGEDPVTTTTAQVDRPDGPAAALAPITGGFGVSLVPTEGPDLADLGWVEEEYVASGRASTYTTTGDLPVDGTFELHPEADAEYATRIVVRRPGDAADFNGTVVVEWLNVSAGFDSSPDYRYMADELTRRGYAWVGVSAQRVGVHGGAAAVPVAGAPVGGLTGIDPARYGDLSHPGDAYAYDIYTQVARALREPGAVDALGGLRAERVLGVGESQSAFALTTYVDGVQPLTLAFDGFVIHSRGAGPAPLGRPGENVQLVDAIGGTPTRIRTDGPAPVIVVQTEGDLIGIIGYLPARQPDSERFRLWEVAGSAHADAYIVGGESSRFDCGGPINAGPQHFVVPAALRSLDTWVRTGEAPPKAPRIEVDESGPTAVFVRDDDGNVRGGIRTPHVDTPVAMLSGEARPGSSVICLLFGQTNPFSPERLAELYPSRDAYLADYEAATDAAIDAGFVLADDRDAVLAEAQPDAIPGG